MAPDFSKKVIDTVAKRAGFLCSNPDCRVSTAGPNTEQSSATIIGEAAHIFAARPGRARYKKDMTDQLRSEISNAIWLCRNCHKKIDHDPKKFTSALLFGWREKHDEYVASHLGSQTDKLEYALLQDELLPFADYPPIIRRIAIDKPAGWEWSLTAELLRYLNAPIFRKLRDIRDEVFVGAAEHIDDGRVFDWVSERLGEMTGLIAPVGKIFERFNRAWGALGEPGDIEEIHHTSILLRDLLEQVVSHEERISCVKVSDEFETLIGLLKNALGSQIDQLADLPNRLDRIVSMIDEERAEEADKPLVISETFEFSLPDNWEKIMKREMKLAKNLSIIGGSDLGVSEANSGCAAWTIGIVVFLVFLMLL
ncbi:MAG: hypothetical protein QUV08_13430 [Parasphingorhabdus sp.]|nr:hypothetical protein [Parasphingorhabdus sp.]